jgi:uncharacterized protein YyaL (SSP411 family)
MADRLADAPSPYLRAHAGNPVDWWPWGLDAFAEAARRDVPVLVSIGYATCHWCHVMARESFEDPELAAWLAERMVAIKVDREEHPEVDAAYLAAASAFTANLGWPLTAFATPQGRVFFAGTYWPPTATGGMPAFRDVLAAVDEAWRQRRGEIEAQGAALAEALVARRPGASSLVTDVGPAVRWLEQHEDAVHGGFGGAPKFPVAPVLRFLVERAEPLGQRTLDAIVASPLRDPVDGGFFRYATRADWSEPHYERMLSDNAQLLAVLALAGRAEAASDVARFLLTTLAVPGGIASAQDSESMIDGQRVEGFYYTLDAASRSRLDPPPLDRKVVTGFVGLAVGALALASRILDRPDRAGEAERLAAAMLDRHRIEGRLIHMSVDGVVSSAPATLEDYGMLARGLLDLALTTGEVRWAVAARELVDSCRAAGAAAGVVAAVPGGGDPVLAAQGLALDPEATDGATPSGLASVGDAALVLHRLTGRPEDRRFAEEIASRLAPGAVERPLSAGAVLALLDGLAQPARQLVVVGERPLGPLARRARAEPRGIVVTVTREQAEAFVRDGFDVFAGRELGPTGETAWLCHDFVCAMPATDLVTWDAQLTAG